MEERFVSLWDDSGIEFCKKTKTNISEQASEPNNYECITEDSNTPSVQTDVTDTTNQPGCIQYPHIEDYNGSIKEGPSQATTESSMLNNWDLESDFESESSFNDFDDNDDPYASMSLDELKRAVLISQSKMLKAAEASARAKEKLKLFELSILQRNDRNEITNFF